MLSKLNYGCLKWKIFFLMTSGVIVGSFSAVGGLAGLVKAALFNRKEPGAVAVKSIENGAKGGGIFGAAVVAAAVMNECNPQDSDLSEPEPRQP